MANFDDFAGGSEPGPLAEFPFEWFRVPGSDAVDRCLGWREEWKRFTPVILGTDEDFSLVTENWEDLEDSPQAVLQRANGLNVGKWLGQRLSEYGDLEDVTNPSEWDAHSWDPAHFHTVSDVLSGEVHPSVCVAKIPTANPCEVPAWLGFGGWNECPEAWQHAAVWRYWQQKHDGRILCLTGAVIEATVEEPPEDEEGCYALAREQFAYCSDIVTQGVGSIDALATTLRGGGAWYFWWD